MLLSSRDQLKIAVRSVSLGSLPQLCDIERPRNRSVLARQCGHTVCTLQRLLLKRGDLCSLRGTIPLKIPDYPQHPPFQQARVARRGGAYPCATKLEYFYLAHSIQFFRYLRFADSVHVPSDICPCLRLLRTSRSDINSHNVASATITQILSPSSRRHPSG